MSPLPLGIVAASGLSAGALELIQTTILASSTSSVTISSIPSTYRHLQLRILTRDSANSFDYMVFRLNGDSGNNYARHLLRGNGTSLFSSANTTLSNGFLGTIANNTNTFSATIADILNYSSTTSNKTIRSLSGQHSTTNMIGLYSGLWMNTAAVNSLTVTSNNGSVSFVAGSRFSLYGIRG